MSNLSEKAMLVHLRISMSLFHIKDSKVSAEVREGKGAGYDSGNWWTYLIPKKELEGIVRAAGKCRAAIDSMTLPWNDSGDRILPSELYFDFTQKLRKATDEYDAEIDKFLKEYPEILQRSQKRLGSLVNTARFPTIAEVKGKFGHGVDIFPLPNSEDFRVSLSDDDVKNIKENMEKTISTKVGAAMASVWQELAELVGKIESTLSEPDRIFRNTLITNLGDFCHLLPKLNIIQSSELENMRKELVEKLANLHPTTLRDNSDVRKKAAKDAKAVLEKMKQYVSV